MGEKRNYTIVQCELLHDVFGICIVVNDGKITAVELDEE